MPELPEIETIRRVLAPQLRGAMIQDVELLRPEVAAHPGGEAFRARLRGQKFADVGRRGKYLMLELENGGHITVHLRMTGCLLIAPANHPRQKHTHLVFHLADGRELRFADLRRFGRLWLFEQGEEEKSGAEKLGVEPLNGLSGVCLREKFGGRQRPIKTCLLEQSAVAGIGNIYSDEILFAARLRPERPAASLSEAEWECLAETIPRLLEFFIEKNAISPEDYLKGGGQDYRNTPCLQVYGHAQTPCPRCQTPLKKQTISGRTSVFCPCCQK